MKDERGKMKEKRATDYIRRDLEDLTVKDLLEILRSQPDGAGEVMPYNSNAKKLEMLKKELDRYLTVPASVKMPANLQKEFESIVMAQYLNPNKLPLTKCYDHAKELFRLRNERYMFPSLSSIERKVHSISAETIAIARGE